MAFVKGATRAATRAATQEVLWVALTFDAESDYFDESLTDRGAESRRLLRWQGIEHGIPLIRTILSPYLEGSAVEGGVTWFVRVDDQLGHAYGDPGYLLEAYRALWQSCLDRGDEIGWHPHLYRLEQGAWRQETDDRRLVTSLRNAYRAMRRQGFSIASSRLGEGFCSNAAIGTLEELGICCDSTAMPGRVRKDRERNLDWGTTPQKPYHPSRSDYRQPGPRPLRLLEVPMSMVETRAEYDRQPRQRYVDLSFYHRVLKEGVRSYLRDAKILVAVTHPCAVLHGITRKKHGLLSFDIEEFKANLEFIFAECRRLGRPYRFVTIGKCRSLFADHQGAGRGR